MAAASLIWDTNMAAVTSCENVFFYEIKIELQYIKVQNSLLCREVFVE